MRISDIIQIAKAYLLLGVAGAGFVIAFILAAYGIIYRKLLKGTKKINKAKVLLWAVFLIYIVVVLGATLGSRTAGIGERVSLHLFSSYREAWNSFSEKEWRNLILNILMFVPLGILLPLILRLCRKFWLTYLLGLASSLLIEVVQLMTGRGVFEADDIFNNTLGCMIGYGIIMVLLAMFFAKNVKENEGRPKVISLVCFQMPLLITILAFSTIFIVYNKKELGNLAIAYSYCKDMSKTDVTTEVKLNENAEKGYVYQAPVGTQKDTLDLANKILGAVKTEVDETQNDAYEDTMIYGSLDGSYSVSVDYIGLKTIYYNFVENNKEKKEGLSFHKVKKLLSVFSIELPDGVEFTDSGDGYYSMDANMLQIGDAYLDGECRCSINQSDVVSYFSNSMILYTQYKEYNLISEKEAYEAILKGKFSSDTFSNISEMKIKAVSLCYTMDSKGFYQPVYQFKAEGTGSNNDEIFIPAIR